MTEPILETRKISKRFGNIQALNGVDINIHANSVLALCGDNGAGKSTLIKIISGVYIPDSGQIISAGKSTKINSPRDAYELGIETVYQDLALCENLNVIQNLFLGREKSYEGNLISNLFLNNKKMFNEAEKVFDILGTNIPSLNNQISTLSGGQRQAVAIARAVVWGSRLVILDEPTAALGVDQTENVHKIIKNLKEQGVGVVLITHNMSDVFALADRVIVMYQGKIVEEGNVLDVFENPKHSYTNNLIQSLPEFKIEKRKQKKIIKKETNNKNIILSIKNLYKEFPVDKGIFKQSNESVKAVQNVSLNVRQNKILGLVGESGSGKSTLGKSIIKLIEPTSGEINFKNQDISNFNGQKMQNIRQKMQMIFQDPFASLNPRKNILDTLMEPILVHKLMKKNEATEYIKQIINDVGLPIESLIRFPHEFSGGQRQRIGIARALVLKPEFIIADEPVSALDVSIQAQVLNLLETIKETYNLTMIFISHDLSVIEYFCDEVAVMYLGHIVEMAPVNELFSNPKHSYTKALLSAVPKVKAKKTNKILIKGDIPSPINPPSGCVFRTRCPNPTHDCKEGNIQMGLIEVSPNHWVDQCCVNCH